LCLAVFGLLLSSSIVLGAVQGALIVSKRNQKPAVTKSNELAEEFTFLIKDFKMDHQGENNNLNISIRYLYKTSITTEEYPDFTVVAKDIETLLANYPNKKDYWEILNKKITAIVLAKYPAITRVTSQIEVSPSANVPYLRSSITTRIRASVKTSARATM
jgi:hypothetical protein